MTKRSKNITIAATCLLVISTLAFNTYLGLVRGGSLDEVADLVPSDAFLFVGTRGAGDLSSEFSDLGLALSEAGPKTDASISIIREMSIEYIGFDLLSLEAWKSSGLSFFRPIGYATFEAVDALRGDALLLLPIGDEDSLIATVTKLTELIGGTVDVEEMPTRQIWETHGANLFGSDVKLAWIVEDNYLIASFSVAADFSPVRRLMNIYGEEPLERLSSSADYGSVVDAISDDWHNFIYVSNKGSEDYSNLVTQGASSIGLPVPMIIPSIPFGIYSTLQNDQISTSIVMAQVPSDITSTLSPLSGSGRDELSHRLDLDPVVIGRVSISIPEIWATAVAYDPSIESIANSGLGVLGIDFEKDILENITGDTVFVIAKEPGSEGLPSAVVHARVKRAEPLNGLIETACPMFLTHLGFTTYQEDDTVACEAEDGIFGVVSEHIFASNNTELISGDLGTGRLSEALPEGAWRHQQEGEPLSIYLDLIGLADLIFSGELAEATNNSELVPSSMARQLNQLQSNYNWNLSPIEGLGLSMSVEDDVMLVTSRIYPNTGSFTGWIRNGLESLLTAGIEEDSGDNERELSAAVEALAGMVTVYEMFEGNYIACGDSNTGEAYRAAPDSWLPSKEATDCLEGQLEWSIDEAPSGAYWVTLVEREGADNSFLAHGISRVGQDFIYFQAGPNGQAVRIVQ